jgi:hypothetical protein
MTDGSPPAIESCRPTAWPSKNRSASVSFTTATGVGEASSAALNGRPATTRMPVTSKKSALTTTPNATASSSLRGV